MLMRMSLVQVQVNMLQKLCGQMGAKYISKLMKLNVPEHFKKIFTKIWGASGKLVLHSFIRDGV